MIVINENKKLREFVENEVFTKHYLFFDKKDKNNQEVYCTKCKSEYEYSGLKHNEIVVCEKCGAELKAKNIKLGRKTLNEEACIYWYSKYDEDTLICEGYSLRRKLDDYKSIDIIYNLQAKYKFKYGFGGKLKLYNWYDREFEERRTVFNFNQGSLANMECYSSHENLLDSIKDTKFKYMPILRKADERTVRDITIFSKYTWLEQLNKLGFTYLVKEIYYGHRNYKVINYKGKTIYKKLGITKGQAKELKSDNPGMITFALLKLFKLLNDNGEVTTFKEVKEFYKEFNYSEVDILDDLKKIVSVKRVTKYLLNQVKKQKEFTNRSLLIQYRDYINAANKLNYDLSNRKILLPNDLIKAHDNAIVQVKVKENKHLDKKIKKRLENLEKYKYECGDYIIRPAVSTKDLIIEGTTLKHCVATNYTKSYAEGKTTILFIRKKDKVDKSLCTVEINKNRIVQARGYRNCKVQEVEVFLKDYEREILNKI